MQEISVCEVCGNESLQASLDLGTHPMCDDLVKVGDPRICKEYPIQILYCDKCGTAHQRFQVPKHELFPSNYHYRSRFTADVLSGMERLVEHCVENFGDLSGKTVIDVGCNDGSLLSFFKQRGASTLGVEPTDAYLDAKERGHVVYGDYFDTDLADLILADHGHADIITFTNVFAHIEDLQGLLEAVKALMHDQTVIVVENHYLGAVIDRNQFDTFYHEHPRTYSFTSFEFIAKTLGIAVLDVEFPSRYGGNIRVFMGSKEKLSVEPKLDLDALRDKEAQFGQALQKMVQDIATWKRNKSDELAALVEQYGSLKAKAFPGRAAILVKLLQLDGSTISAVHEKPGSLKIGHYLPGTRIPIVSDDDFEDLAERDAPLVNFAWHISEEIRTYLRNAGFNGQIIDILSSEDFN